MGKLRSLARHLRAIATILPGLPTLTVANTLAAAASVAAAAPLPLSIPAAACTAALAHRGTHPRHPRHPRHRRRRHPHRDRSAFSTGH